MRFGGFGYEQQFGFGLSPTPAASAAPAVAPSFVSATGFPYGGTPATSYTPFTGLDLSNCDVALVWVHAVGHGNSAASSTASAGWTRIGQRFYNVSINPTASFSLFAKIAPTSSEELVVTIAAGTPQWNSVLERVADADTVIWNTGATFVATANVDPGSYDTGASRAYLFTAGICSNTINFTAGPANYENFTAQDGAGGGVSAVAIATAAATAQTTDPSAFTNTSARGAVAIAACYTA